MTARGRDGDERIPYRSVPLYIRRAAKAAFEDETSISQAARKRWHG
jgi:hypothetical protein